MDKDLSKKAELWHLLDNSLSFITPEVYLYP